MWGGDGLDAWMGWSSWVIGLLRAPSVLMTEQGTGNEWMNTWGVVWHEGSCLNDNKIDNEVRSLISMRGAPYKTIKEGKWYLPFITTRTQTGCADNQRNFFAKFWVLHSQNLFIFLWEKKHFFRQKNTFRDGGSTALDTLITLLTCWHCLHCFYCSNCFTLLKQKHVRLILYILWGNVRTLLAWADEQ